VVVSGTPLEQATAALVLVHGRGATADSIIGLGEALAPEGVAILAPQAADRTWYPRSFVAPREQNEPYLTSALHVVDELVAYLGEQGIAPERIALGGFSQGACLASEYASRAPQRYGALIAFSGGLIGPMTEPQEREGDLAGTPVFLGCSDVDPHIPLQRVHETKSVLEAMGAEVTEQIYPGMGHTINPDELAHAKRLLDALADDSSIPA
jgi:predicted esterase